MMRKVLRIALLLCVGLIIGAGVTFMLVKRDVIPQRGELAQELDKRVADVASGVDLLKKLSDEGYEANPLVLKQLATGGQPVGRWKEGLMFDGVEPMPWLKSA